MKTFTHKPVFVFLAYCYLASAMATDAQVTIDGETTTTSSSVRPDSVQLEQDLQQLDWIQFKSVVESVPKLKADVDAYGAFGWQYVKTNYTTYGWKKSIDKLDHAQKQQLAELIRNAKSAR